jgi:hypothetical protein
MHLDCYNCVLCSYHVEENLDHLFLICPFPRSCWSLLNINLPSNYSILEILILIKDTGDRCLGVIPV